MTTNEGLVTIEALENLMKTDLFKELEKFSNGFLRENKEILQEYSKKWVKDPLHQWSRLYEYPFVLKKINNYIDQNNDEEIEILDAGSGITFFPYLLNKKEKTKVTCCDYDKTLEKYYSEINSKQNKTITFQFEDIRKLSFSNKKFDIIYCISVLEHTKNFEEIIKEFKRVLKPNGILIATFDISIDGASDIPKDKAVKLLKDLEKHFTINNNINNTEELEKINSEKILTTKHTKKKNPKLLPWKYPKLMFLKNLLTLNFKKAFKKNICCYCLSLKNDKNEN